MTICVDFDGVLADTSLVKRRWIAAVTGRWITSPCFDRSTIVPLIGETAYMAMQSEVGYADTLLALPVVNAVDVLGRLSFHSTIVVVSARPVEKLVWVRRWLGLHSLSETVSSVVSSFGRSKADVACDVRASWLVDDDGRHAVGLDVSTQFVLFGARRNRSENMCDLVIARDWLNVEEIVSANL